PKFREGYKMNLAQLTDKDTIIKGYSKLRILMMLIDGEILETEVEAYVVSGMSVPILLGEDYQLNYELGVSRNVELGTKILFGGTEHEVSAEGVVQFRGRSEIHHLRRMNGERHIVMAAEETRIMPHSSKIVRLAGNFSEDKEWLVDMNILANTDDTFFSIPKTLISARRPCVPVSNLSDHPRIIRKGEILGSLVDPQEFFDKPRFEGELEELRKKSTMITALIQANLKAKTERKDEKRPGAELRIRTDFGTGIPPSEENVLAGVHI
ncbi:hypothetical protein C8R44DRAFT_605407, partial [Mycena epipterygia]